MDNPEYTERAINEALGGHGISVVWDGDEPATGEAASFYVCADGDDTDLMVRDHGYSFEIIEGVDNRSYVSVDEAQTFDALAAKLVSIIDRLGEDA